MKSLGFAPWAFAFRIQIHTFGKFDIETLMFKLTQDYAITTPKSIVYIFGEIKRNQQLQKKNGSFWDVVDYRAFNLSIKRIEIERYPSVLNPFKGLGTIYFEFTELEGETMIKCTIDSYGSWIVLSILCMMAIFLLILTTLILFSADGNYLALSGFIVFMWTLGIGAIYVGWCFNMYMLKEHSKVILKELKVIS